MIDSAAIISHYGIAILVPIAVIEGPIVTIVAAYFASQGLLSLWEVIVCVIAADLVGDCLLYGLGMYLIEKLPQQLRASLGVTPDRLASVVQSFENYGARILVFAKLTHAAGFPVLIAAGTSHMPIQRFILANFAATVPKSLVFVTIGYFFGPAHALISHWLSLGSAMVLAVIAALLLAIYRSRRKGRA